MTTESLSPDMSKQRITFEELDNYIAAINGAGNLDEILGILQKQVNLLGFDRLTYWLRWPSKEAKQPVFISTYPIQFIDHYIENDYQSHDMVGRFSTEKNTPFVWTDIGKEIEITRMQQIIFSDSSSVGLKSGGSIPIHGPRQIKATFSVTSDISNEEFEDLFNYHRHELHILATYAHEKIMSLGIDNPIKNVSLSAREAQILTWVARGKTYWEIGVILGIQEDTVKKHMMNICKVLEVSNGSHAVSKAVIHGLIIP